MKKTYDTGPEPVKAYLVGMRSRDISVSEASALTAELAGLADTLGLEISGGETVNIREKNPRYCMGSGKAEEIAQKAVESGAECIVFDAEISPTQQRNWESLSGLSAVDRQELIIRIFASRARTREAELQAGLAELLYALPRLSHKYIDLSRQRGGRYGTRGSGETRLETDRRLIEQRIGALKTELEEVRKNRGVQRKQRERSGVPVCALVGYTNAGKSSLHHALTGSGVYVEDKLFATLDPTARRTRTPSGKNIILVDTVGFIRRLPHNLVDAFRSTLEEAARSDLLLHVLDISDPAAGEHTAAVLSVLRELGAEQIPLITVYNKADLLDPRAGSMADGRAAGDFAEGGIPQGVLISAVKKEGLAELWELVEKQLAFDGKALKN
ncbi:MAG: GTPase HflX [Treponema sp.]|jgi:GTP-binding protein HflX|nr:GTPase HflX [Treponema sp.]